MNTNEFKGLKILIVDDEADLRMINVDRFTLLGCEVFEASNGQDAFEVYLRVKPRVVLTDMQMSGGTGLELLSWIRAHVDDSAPRPIVVIATGYSDTSSKELASAGADAVVAKPYSMKQISEVVQKVLSSATR